MAVVADRLRRAWRAARFPVLLTAIALSMGACSGPGDRERLVITGSSTVSPLMGEIARKFEAEHSGVRVDVQSGGSSQGINDVEVGTAAIGMVSRELTRREDHLRGHLLAHDAVGLIVHADNPVADLSRDQLRAIYTGAVGNWNELGGADRSITVVNKADGRATLAVFLQRLELERPSLEPDVIIGENQQGIRTVARNPGAIAYVSAGAADLEIGFGQSIRLVAIDGADPLLVAQDTGNAPPMTRPLLLVTRPELSPVAERFIDFARSPEIHDLIREYGFVPP